VPARATPSCPIFIRHAPAAPTHALLEIADTEIGSITTRYVGGVAPIRSAVIELSTTVYRRAALTSQMARRSYAASIIAFSHLYLMKISIRHICERKTKQ